MIWDQKLTSMIDSPDTLNQFASFNRKQLIWDDMGPIKDVDYQWTLTLKLLCVPVCLTLSAKEGKWMIRTPLSVPNILSRFHVILLSSKCRCLALFIFHRQTGILIGFRPSPHSTYFYIMLLQKTWLILRAIFICCGCFVFFPPVAACLV